MPLSKTEPEIGNVVEEAKQAFSETSHLHPDDIYWPPEESPSQTEGEISQSNEVAATPTAPEALLHPDDVYWPASNESCDTLMAADNEPPFRDTALALADTRFGDDKIDTLLPDDLDAFDDEEREFNFIVSTPEEVSDGPPNMENESFGGFEELNLEPNGTMDSSEDGNKDTFDWVYDLDDDWSGDSPSTVFADEGENIPAWRISEHTGSLVDMLPLDTTKQRDVAFDTVCALLEEFPHGSSVKAISRQIGAGMTLDDLLRCANLKRLWKDDTGLWLRRDYREGIRVCPTQRHALTWAGAGKLIREHVPGTLEEVLLGEWRQAWIEIDAPELGERALPSWFSYAAFLEGQPLNWVTDMTAMLGAGLETGWAYSAAASRPDFQERTGEHPYIATAARNMLSQIAKPTFYEER